MADDPRRAGNGGVPPSVERRVKRLVAVALVAGCTPDLLGRDVARPPYPAERTAPPMSRREGAALLAPPATAAAQAPTAARAPLPDPPFLETPRARSADTTLDEPLVAPQAPPLYAGLFDMGRRLRYRVARRTAPHDVDGRVTVRHLEVTCTVEQVVAFRLALASETVCEEDGAPARTWVFVSSPGGLWSAAAVPADEDALARLVRDPPLLAESPVRRRRAYEAPLDADVVVRCNETVTVGPGSVCVHETCERGSGWGDTEERTCFRAGRGVEQLRLVNLSGPSTEVWQLLRVEPRPEPDTCHG